MMEGNWCYCMAYRGCYLLSPHDPPSGNKEVIQIADSKCRSGLVGLGCKVRRLGVSDFGSRAWA